MQGKDTAPSRISVAAKMVDPRRKGLINERKEPLAEEGGGRREIVEGSGNGVSVTFGEAGGPLRSIPLSAEGKVDIDEMLSDMEYLLEGARVTLKKLSSEKGATFLDVLLAAGEKNVPEFLNDRLQYLLEDAQDGLKTFLAANEQHFRLWERLIKRGRSMADFGLTVQVPLKRWQVTRLQMKVVLDGIAEACQVLHGTVPEDTSSPSSEGSASVQDS